MWVAVGALAALAVVAGVVAVALHRVEPYLHARIVEGLHEHFHARVELDSFHVSLVGGVSAEGKGLRIWPPAQVAGVAVPEAAAPDEPLIRLDEFRFHAPLRYRPGEPVHISEVQLKGLAVHLPPKSHFQHAAGESRAAGAAGGQGEAGNSAAAGAEKPAGAALPETRTESAPATAGLLSFSVDTVECNGAELVLGTSKPGKLPLKFAIAHLKLTHVTSGGAMGFDAELTNPRPVGTIHTTGSFGPWLVEDPGESDVSGTYRFEHADLGDFKGIAGILSSTGRYTGTLRDIVADGETDTPDFRLTHFGNAMALHTRFHARIDGTNGDTWLEPVDAMLGHSHFTAQGQIVRVAAGTADAPREGGHDIALTVNVDRARIEDFLHLASHGTTPVLTGDVTLKTTLHIPPGPALVHERMSLDGTFHLDRARFSSEKIQDRIRELSLRGQGRPNEVKTTDADSIRSEMDGSFTMAGGVITLSKLDYTVPGARIELKGTFGLEGGTLDFTGSAKMQATVSQMVGGWKGLLLKPADRFLKKDGAGVEIPIHIRGTREAPEFGIDFERMKAGLGEKPGAEQK